MTARRRIGVFGVLALLVSALAVPQVGLAAGTGVFTAHPTTPSFGAGNSRDVTLGDLDQDGDLDAVVANGGTEAETVWLNNGLGSYSAHPTTPTFGVGNSWEVALGDLDSDGDLDAVVANAGTQAETVWRNDGAGNFSAHPTTPSFGVGNSFGVSLADLDRDGDLDAVVANFTDQAESVWLNDGVGNFTAHPTTPTFGGSSTYMVALGDLDNDGDLDLVASNGTNQPETTWLNDGLGNFTAHPTVPSFGTGTTWGVALGDLDLDGDLDALSANGGTQAETVWTNDGSGAFSAGGSFGGDNSWDVALGDLDQDGDLDAVIGNYAGQAETVWVNSGGVFAPLVAGPSFGLGSTYAVELGDLDHDSDLDVVVANDGVEAEMVWLNGNRTASSNFALNDSFGTGNTRAVALGDLDRDGDPDAVVANGGVQVETVWLNDGLGFFTAHPTKPTFGSGNSSAVALGDLDLDGDLDAVVANIGVQNETLWTNDGTGAFSAAGTINGGNSYDVALGDLNGDGRLDIVFANIANLPETVWLNTSISPLTYGAGNVFGTGTSYGIALGDLDGDSDLDAVVANGGGQAETVWLNDGTGTFSLHPVTPSFGNRNSWDVALGDLDKDGDLDAVVANATNQLESVWRNDGNGNFTPHPTRPNFGAGNSYGVELGDFDQDGDLDALVVNNNGQANTLWRNNGAGVFSAHPTTPSFDTGDSWGAALADIDKDGDLDAVIATYGTAENAWRND